MKKILTVFLIFGLLAITAPAFASEEDSVLINVANNSEVTNNLNASAATGANNADGAAALNTVAGGNITDSDYGNTAGNGGNTVLGGMGGQIQTGNASATAHVDNRMNSTFVKVKLTPWTSGTITLNLDNLSAVGNDLRASGVTGENAAKGAEASSSVLGGDLNTVGAENTAGNAAGHVEAGGGGTIITGDAASHVHAVNVMNRSVTRIRR